MGTSSSSCDRVCRVYLFWLACPVPFCFWRLCIWRISFSLLCSFVCLLPSLVTMGMFTAKGRRGFCKDWTALVDIFKKTLQASTVLSILSRVFLPYTVSVKLGECLKTFSTSNLIHPKQSSLLFYRKAVKTQTECFNPCFVCMWRFAEVSFFT